MIATHLPTGDRGVIAGVKQSGVQLASFFAGLSLPVAASAASWRWALTAYALITIAIALLAMFALPADPRRQPKAESDRSQKVAAARLNPFVYRVAIYALLLGMAGGGVFRFIALFAHESVGFSKELAGIVVAVNGILGVVGRLFWGRITESGFPPRKGLLVTALGGAVCSAMLLVANSVPALLWLFAVLAAFSSSAWNVVAMLAVIRAVPVEQQGRATGVVMMGFLGGLTIGTPLTGWATDLADGSYTPAWIGATVLALLGAAVMQLGSGDDGEPSLDY